MKNIKLKTAIVVAIVIAMWFFFHKFGPLDTYPRIRQTATSPDGEWRFEVYKRKDSPLNPCAETILGFRITDVKQGRIYERGIWQTTSWISFDHRRKFNVRFEKDYIIVNDFWVVNKTNLRLRMCPLLNCLEDPDQNAGVW